jgi:hypothetical protein
MGTDIKINETEVTIDFSSIVLNLDEIYKEIIEKSTDLRNRVKQLRDKEKMLDEFIARNHGALEATQSSNYKLRSQLQNTIMRQLEAQQVVIETVIKYENLIQTYTKQKMELQNNKVSNYTRWKNTNKENASEKEFLEVIQKFENAIKNNELSLPGTENKPGTENDFQQSILESTFEDGYKL